MELPSRPKNDRYTKPGQYNELERLLRRHSDAADIPCLVCYAFDWRTRLGPFLYHDLRLLPGGPRAIAGALLNVGFTNTRIVLGQWNPRIRPSLARLDGKVPQMLFVSSMQIHSAHAYQLVADAHKLGEDRPFILAGGGKAIYEPWDYFGIEHNGGVYSADVAVTGEEFVLLELLDRMMLYRGKGEHPRKTFHRLRRSGLLDDIPGLVFRAGDENAPFRPVAEGQTEADEDQRLINTGIQRLVQNLDELPPALAAFGVVEPAHRRQTLSSKPLPLHRVSRYTGTVSLVTTHGCKFRCPYCPIPAYNQFTFRFKSPERLRKDIEQISEATGVYSFYGTDDNFFNDRQTVEETFTELVRGKVHGKPFRDSVWFFTEATEFDVYKNQDLLPLCRAGGLRAMWFGIEDMTAELVKKGQSPEKTEKLFTLLMQHGINPMPMMMHHDGQPLYSRGKLYGLLNQVGFLRKTGAASMQVTSLMPSIGSKSYSELFNSGLVIGKAGERKLEDYQYDGNHCIATTDPRPWRRQINLYLAYASFYNPLNFVRTFINRSQPNWELRVMYQLMGMWGLAKSVKESWGWLRGLYKGPIEKLSGLPAKRWLIVPPPVRPELAVSTSA